MKQKLPRRRGLSLLLALAMVLSLAPAAFAAETCPEDGKAHTVKRWEIVLEANCHEKGLRRGECSKCGQMVYEDIAIDKNNHDAKYTDNGDGETHSAVCPYDSYSRAKEPHEFDGTGRCVKCLAVNYSEVKLSLPGNQTVYVELGDTDARLKLEGARLTLGSADVTDEYTITYNWYEDGEAVATGATYDLPLDVVEDEGRYTYTCFVMAVPRSGFSGSPQSGSCTVTVVVQDLAAAYAALPADEEYLDFDETNSRTPVCIVDQIYDAVNERSEERPEYIIFDTVPSNDVGTITAKRDEPYYFDPDRDQSGLSELSFEVDDAENSSGTYTVAFTAYDERDNDYPGMLTVTVEQPLGDMDVLYTAADGKAVTLAGDDFEDFWLDNYSSGELTLIRFTTLPRTSQGILYADYTSASRPGTRVRTGDSFYYDDSGRNRTLIDDLTFVPDEDYSGYVSIPFEAYGENNRGTQTTKSGDLCILVSSGSVESVSYQVTSGGTVQMDGDDFLDVYQEATGSRGSSFYIQLMELPENGALYVDYTGSSRDSALRERDLDDYLFYYSSSRGDVIDDLTYVAGNSLTDSFRYMAYSTSGELLYIGQVDFSRGNLTVRYTAGLTGVSFRASDFEDLLGSTAGRDTYVTFSQPTSGTLTNSRTGSAVSSNDKFYLGNDLQNVNNVKYTPRTGQSGTVNIPFTIHTGNSSLTGTAQITVRTTYTKSFTDVRSSDWYYTAVMDLAEAGVIDGMTPTTYSPDTTVTNAQALKLILLAAGYSEPAQTGRHWASGYLSLAAREGLLPTSSTITENNLDNNISRYAIAEIAAKALKLPSSTLTTSPFNDMAMTNASASYVLSLYEAGIVEGTTLSNGQVMYYGVNAIRRSEMATIVWRMYNYKTSNP